MAGRALRKDDGDEILSGINIIPLVDISLVLLIIFMVTANYIMTSSFTVDISQAKHAKTTQQNNVVNITIFREGAIRIENEPVTVSELRSKAQAKYKDNPDISVVLYVDKNVNFKNVVSVLDLLSELGITRLNIAAAAE